MSRSELICKEITKAYKGKEVLQNVDLTLEAGKIYGLIGRNGAGKTTLLSIMSAQNPPTDGTVTLGGEKIWENRRALEQICFSRELAPTAMGNGAAAFRVKEYLEIASLYYSHWDQNMADELIEKCELKKKQKIAKLSKGMMSMVTVIVALASKAPFTFLDEPVAGLDVIMREFFYKFLLQEYAESGRTFVISTHIIEEAADIFEEVIMLNRGKILLKENTRELVERTFHVSGKAEDVNEAVREYECHSEEQIGRSKGVTVILKKGQEVPAGKDITVQPVNLQKVFVALCGMGE